MPATGVKAGVATLMVYVPVAIELSARPDRYAIALMVVFAVTAIGAVNRVPVVEVGVLPSMVYRIVAPDVAVLMVTLCAVV